MAGRTLLLVLLTVAVQVLVAALGLLLAASRWDVAARLRALVASQALGLVAVVATFGSLYLSEVAGFIPASCAGSSGSRCTRWRCCWCWPPGGTTSRCDPTRWPSR